MWCYAKDDGLAFAAIPGAHARGCLQFRPPSYAGRSPQRAGSVRVCGGVADTHAGI